MLANPARRFFVVSFFLGWVSQAGYHNAGPSTALVERARESYSGQKQIFEDQGFVGLSVCDASSANLTFYAADGQVQATVSLSADPPESNPEPGRPALANGNAAVPSPVCGGRPQHKVGSTEA